MKRWLIAIIGTIIYFGISVGAVTQASESRFQLHLQQANKSLILTGFLTEDDGRPGDLLPVRLIAPNGELEYAGVTTIRPDGTIYYQIGLERLFYGDYRLDLRLPSLDGLVLTAKLGVIRNTVDHNHLDLPSEVVTTTVSREALFVKDGMKTLLHDTEWVIRALEQRLHRVVDRHEFRQVMNEMNDAVIAYTLLLNKLPWTNEVDADLMHAFASVYDLLQKIVKEASEKDLDTVEQLFLEKNISDFLSALWEYYFILDLPQESVYTLVDHGRTIIDLPYNFVDMAAGENRKLFFQAISTAQGIIAEEESRKKAVIGLPYTAMKNGVEVRIPVPLINSMANWGLRSLEFRTGAISFAIKPQTFADNISHLIIRADEREKSNERIVTLNYELLDRDENRTPLHTLQNPVQIRIAGAQPQTNATYAITVQSLSGRIPAFFEKPIGLLLFETNRAGDYRIQKRNLPDHVINHWSRSYISSLITANILNEQLLEDVELDSSINPVLLTSIVEQVQRLYWNSQAKFEVTADPTATFVREELAKLLFQWSFASEMNAIDVFLDFDDREQISAGAEPAVAYSVRNGWIQGRLKNRFEPQQEVTFAEATTVAARLLTWFSYSYNY